MKSEEQKKNLTISIIAAIVVILQPLLWYLVWSFFATESPENCADCSPNVGLTIVCLGSCIGTVIMTLWIRGYIIEGENPWD